MTPSPTADRDTAKRQQIAFALAAILLTAGLAARAALSWQSLWYDEIYTIWHYIGGSWAEVFWQRYSPNNHLLYTITTKLLRWLTGSSEEQLMRLPAEIAGLWVPLLLAAGYRRENRPLALLIVAAAMLHPWLLTFSSEARGYTLMLALALLATNLLGDARTGLSWRYILAMSGAILTIPIAGVVLAGHALASLRHGRAAAAKWLLSAASVLVVCGLVYLPQLAGAAEYLRTTHPTESGLPLSQLVPQVVWHAVAGFGVGPVGWGWVILPAVVALTVAAWRLPASRDIVLSCAVAAVLTVAIAAVVPGAGRVRFVLWVIPLVTLGLASVAWWMVGVAPPPRLMTAATVGVLALSASAAIPLYRTPAQPIEDVVLWARSQEDHRYLTGVGLGAFDAYAWYRNLDDAAYDLTALRRAEQAGANQIRLVILYPQVLAEDDPQMWTYVQEHYTLELDLPGRVSHCQVFRERP